MIIFSHSTGNAYIRQALLALVEAQWLSEFHTSTVWQPESTLNQFLPKRITRQLGRRTFPGVPPNLIQANPWFDWGREFFDRCRALGITQSAFFDARHVGQMLDRKVARLLPDKKGIFGVYTQEDMALETFRQAKTLGIKCLYELPIGYWRVAQQIFDQEKELKPDWQATLPAPIKAKDMMRKDEEIGLADCIFVASTFTQETLKACDVCDAAVYKIPYGAPSPIPEGRVGLPRTAMGCLLRVLYVGSLGQRKGISYLFEALEPLQEHIEVTIIGKRSEADCPSLDRCLSRCTWIPSVPHAEILEEMERHDVLVFPSLFEGFGLVILEAMSRGIPVITTSHTAGPDFITNGINGFIVPIRSSQAITHCLEQLIRYPDHLRDMKRAAWGTARANTWDVYRKRIIQAVGEVLANA